MKGIGVSPGISIGNACIIYKAAIFISGIRVETKEEKDVEAEKFDKAVLSAIEEVNFLREKNALTLNSEEKALFDNSVNAVKTLVADMDRLGL